jgi:transposase
MVRKPISRDTRIKIKTVNNFNNYSYKSIAEICGVSTKCVFTTLHNDALYGDVAEKKHSGRPRKTTKKQDKELFNLARADPTASVRDLSQTWMKNDKRLGSRMHLSDRLREFGLNSHAEKPLLTEAHKAKRLAWCFDKRNWSYSKWAEVIFTDEVNYKVINRKTRPLVRRLLHEKYFPKMIMPRKQGGGGSIGIWGCIGELGAGCCTTYRGHMNAKSYIRVLENHLKSSIVLLKRSDEKVIFQQDGAGSCSSRCDS